MDNDNEFVETAYRNLYFIRIEKQPQIDFVIYNANLFLNIVKSEVGSDQVWFVRDKSVVCMEWGTPV